MRSEAHTFGGSARRLAASEGLKGAGTRSEAGRTPFGPHTLPRREAPASPGRPSARPMRVPPPDPCLSLLAVSAAPPPGMSRPPLGKVPSTSAARAMDRYGGLFPRLEEAIADGFDVVLRESLAASSRPETASVARLRRSAG
jgi:hypothetical protein